MTNPPDPSSRFGSLPGGRSGQRALRVLLAEDQALVRDGLRLLLELHGLEVTAVEDGRQAVEAAGRGWPGHGRPGDGGPGHGGPGHGGPGHGGPGHGGPGNDGPGRPAPFDVALIDVRMPVLDGIGCVRALRAEHPDLPILMLTTYDDDRLVRECLAAGADAYLLKDIDADDLVNAVRLLAAGGGLIPGDLARRIAGDLGPHNAAEPPRRPACGAAGPRQEPLTPRQREVLALIAAGLTNREIAQRLYLSEGTVKNVVSEIYARLDVRDRVQAVLKARGLRS